MLATVAAVVLIAWVSAAEVNAARGDERPNIVFILADDLAWTDLGCYGHPWHETPHLDQLASEGMRFTEAYAPAPICSAARASIMTGKSTARLGFEFVTKNRPGRQQRLPSQSLDTPPFTLNLPLEETTVAEQLRDAGYQTAFFGKWHLNAHYGGYLGWSPTHGPKQQGFETAIEGFGSHPYGYAGTGNKPPKITQPGRFPNDSLVDNSIGFLKGQHPQPFFLMVSHYYVHTPVETPCQWLLEKYAQKVPVDSPNRKQRIAYAAFVETLDHYVGELLTALGESGHRDDTLVVFTSDNGGQPEFAANGPLRGSKWNLYEGGIRVPLLVRWPGHVPAKTTCSTPVIGYDLLPTFAEVAGKPVEKRDGTLDGLSLVPTLGDPTKQMVRPLYWHFPYYHPEQGFDQASKSIGVDDFAISQTRPQSAIRRGNWKLIYFDESDRGELYDLSHDVGEQTDLSEAQPTVARRLQRELNDYLDRVHARRPVRPAGGDKSQEGTEHCGPGRGVRKAV
jgi:arylsulfatase A